MRDFLRHLRLRKQAETISDPEDAALVRRLADLQELDLRRRSLPIGSPEREQLADQIAKRSHRIVEDTEVAKDA